MLKSKNSISAKNKGNIFVNLGQGVGLFRRLKFRICIKFQEVRENFCTMGLARYFVNLGRGADEIGILPSWKRRLSEMHVAKHLQK